MTQETTILKTDLKNIFDPIIIEHLCRDGYRKTGNKFELSFNGSKGYLSHISINCEGFQKENNRVFRDELFNKNGSIKKKTINVFYSDKKGIRLSTGSDKPKVILKEKPVVNKKVNFDDDLPF